MLTVDIKQAEVKILTDLFAPTEKTNCSLNLVEDSSKQKDGYGVHKTSPCEVFLMAIFCGEQKICIGESRHRMSPVFSLYVAVKHPRQNHLACSLQ